MAQAVFDEHPLEQYLRQAGDDQEPMPGTIAELTQELEQLSLPLLSDTDDTDDTDDPDTDTDTDTPIYPLGMQHHMGEPTNMMTLGGRMVNGSGPHGSGRMRPQMGGMMPQMSHPMGPPGVPPNMTVQRQNMAMNPPSSNGNNGLDPALVFRPDGDINFLRDFGQWFHPDLLDLYSGGGGNNGAPGTGGNGAPGSAAGAGPGGGVGGGSNSGGPNSGISSGIGGGMNSMNPPSSNGNNGDGNGGMGDMQDLVFSHESMNTLVNGLDPAVVFRPDGDINFERDFGQWFCPEDLLDFR